MVLTSILKSFLSGCLFLLYGAVYSQSDFIQVRREGILYMDGYRVYENLSSDDSTKILRDFVQKLNGCWNSGNNISCFTISEETFLGGWKHEKTHSTAPFAKIELVSGQIKLIVIDVLDGEGTPRNIRIDQDTLILQSAGSVTNEFRFERVK